MVRQLTDFVRGVGEYADPSKWYCCLFHLRIRVITSSFLGVPVLSYHRSVPKWDRIAPGAADASTLVMDGSDSTLSEEGDILREDAVINELQKKSQILRQSIIFRPRQHLYN